MAEAFDRDRFKESVGSTFKLRAANDVSVDLTLSEVSDGREDPRWTSFSIVFLAPETWMVDQGLYEVEHENLGAMHLFLVPVGMDEGRMQLEAVFNLSRDDKAKPTA